MAEPNQPKDCDGKVDESLLACHSKDQHVYAFGDNILQIEDFKSVETIQHWLIAPLLNTAPTAISFEEITKTLDDVQTELNSRLWFVHSNCYGETYYAAISWNDAVNPQIYKLDKDTNPGTDYFKHSGSQNFSAIEYNKHMILDPNCKYLLYPEQIPPDIIENFSNHHKRSMNKGYLYSICNDEFYPPTRLPQGAEFLTRKQASKLSTKHLISYKRKQIAARIEASDGPRLDDVTAADPPTGYNAGADTLPFRRVLSTVRPPSSFTAEYLSKVPYSPVFMQFKAKLDDQDSSTALRSMLSQPLFNNVSALLYLVDKMTKYEGNFKDVHPFVVCMLINYSLCTDIYTAKRLSPCIDSVVEKVLPPIIVDVDDSWYTKKMNICIMSMTNAMTWMEGLIDVPNDSRFKPNLLDETWCMVPFDSRHEQLNILLSLVFSHSGSHWWNGRINIITHELVNITITDAAGKQEEVRRMINNTFIPASNSVQFDGYDNIMLVYVAGDGREMNKSFKVGDMTIPITAPNVAPVSFDITSEWKKFFSKGNEPTVIQKFFHVYESLVITSNTGDTLGRSLSIAAELSCSTAPGFLIRHNKDGKLNETIDACWSYKPSGSTAFKNKFKVNSFFEDVTPTNTRPISKRLIGYNFGHQSPMLQAPIGVTKTKISSQVVETTNHSGTKLSYYNANQVIWATDSPRKAYDMYSMHMSTSYYRVATFCKLLILNKTQTYIFQTPGGMCCFIKVLAAALYDCFSSFLLLNDISLRAWGGWDDNFDASFRNLATSTSRIITMDILIHCSPVSFDEKEDEWAFDLIDDWYGIDYSDRNGWAANSCVPICNTRQWLAKNGVFNEPDKKELTLNSFYLDGRRFFGINILSSFKEFKAYLVSIISDQEGKFPLLYISDAFTNAPYYQDIWVNTYSFNSASHNQLNVDLSLTSSTFLKSVSLKVYFDQTTTRMYLVDGDWYANKSVKNLLVQTSDLQFPDPPWYSNFLSWARDYLIRPAMKGGVKLLETHSPLEGVKEAAKEVEKSMDRRAQNEHEESLKRLETEAASVAPKAAEISAAEISDNHN